MRAGSAAAANGGPATQLRRTVDGGHPTETVSGRNGGRWVGRGGGLCDCVDRCSCQTGVNGRRNLKR